jgi:ketosteroid isomerase-like protein
MSDNIATVRRGYAAFNTGDMATLGQVFDANATWVTPGRSARAGDRKGRDAIFEHFGKLGSETNGSFRATLQQIAQTEDGSVIAVHRNTAERNGKKLDVVCSLVFQLKDGRITGGRESFDDLYAWDAFWA